MKGGAWLFIFAQFTSNPSCFYAQFMSKLKYNYDADYLREAKDVSSFLQLLNQTQMDSIFSRLPSYDHIVCWIRVHSVHQ